MPAKSDPLRLALLALAFLLLRPLSARAQDVLCDEGEREVRAVNFVGNTRFDSDELSAFVLTTPSSLTRRYTRRFGAARCFPDIGLANDVSNLKAYYRNNGYYDTRVDTLVTPQSRNRVDVTFRITEGQPLILDSLLITGLDSVPDRQAILAGLPLALGQPAGRLQMASAADSITVRLRNAGYARAVVYPAFATHLADHRADAELNVQTGARSKVGTIAVHSVGVTGGRPSIDSGVVVKLLGIGTGDVYSERALGDAQRRLYNMGIYRHVGITLDTNVTQADTIAGIDVDLREDFLHSYDQEERWSQLDCFGINAVRTDKNFLDQAWRQEITVRFSKLGYAEKASTDATRRLCDRHYMDKDSLASSKVNDYIGVAFRAPPFRNFTPAYSIYTERKGQYQAYLRTTDIGGSVAATREIAYATTLRLGYTLEQGATQAEPVVLCAIFSFCAIEEQGEVQQRKRLGIASVGLQRSTTDNPVTPTRGYNFAIETRYSATFLVSDPTQTFRKVTAELSWFRQLTRVTTLALRARGGFIGGGVEASGNRLPPPQERLYAGGPYSVRGFQESQLGPQVYLLDRNAFKIDTIGNPGDSTYAYVALNDARPNRSVPGGGNVLAVFNAELRVRDPFFPQLIEYIPFVDAGQVWLRQAEKNQLHSTPLAITPGISVRYFSPVGPIQANVGYNRYPPRAGPAYFLSDAGGRTRPLICVTSPGEPVVPVTRQNGELTQDVKSCPSTFVPFESSGFLKNLTFTFTISSSF